MRVRFEPNSNATHKNIGDLEASLKSPPTHFSNSNTLTLGWKVGMYKS